MIDINVFPEKIFVEKSSFEYPLTRSILKKLDHVPFKVIENIQALEADFEMSRDPVSKGKRYLLLTRQKGDFVKPCPCTPNYLGCNYYIINLDLNCPLDCSYCILQHYLASPIVTVHVNTDKLWVQLDSFLQQNRRPLRIGTGELGDSLVLDHLTGRSRELIRYFSRKRSALFELKTKTINIKNVMDTEPAENIIIAWSLNARKIAQTEEKGAPPVEARLQAAQEVIKKGYRVAFHFDPIIRFSGWEDGYAEIVEKMLKKIPAAKIAWISLGSLRFPKELKTVIAERFPDSKILYEEFIQGMDGKLRYFLPLRMELYEKMIGFIRSRESKKITLYFCMESKQVWKKILKIKLESKEQIESYLSLPPGYLRF